jgi:hypothetical protein
VKTDILEVGKKVIPLKGLHGVKWERKHGMHGWSFLCIIRTSNTSIEIKSKIESESKTIRRKWPVRLVKMNSIPY